MPTKRPSPGPLRKDYAGGGSDSAQKNANASSTQKGMIDDDMGKYGGVSSTEVPKTVDKVHERVVGGGSPGSYREKKDPAKARGQRP
jgi:hypothetical protein